MMTEADWLRETKHSQGMAMQLGKLGFARTKSGRRKLRLFACACCRAAWSVLPNDRLRDAVEVAERFADGLANNAALAAAHQGIRPLASDSGPFGKSPRGVRVSIDMAIGATHALEAAFLMTAMQAPLAGVLPGAAAEKQLCHLFRCIFGNPFSPVVTERAWLTPTVVRLARGIGASRTCPSWATRWRTRAAPTSRCSTTAATAAPTAVGAGRSIWPWGNPDGSSQTPSPEGVLR